MNQEQLKTFIYCCQNLVNKANYDHERQIRNLLDGKITDKSFLEVIIRNQKIVESFHLGVCFTMTCWAYHLLYTMGIEGGYYLAETNEKKTGFPNYVLLYEVDGEYRICDLAEQVQKNEQTRELLLQYALNIDNYSSEEKDKTLKRLVDTTYLSQRPDEYFKNYNSGFVYDAKGIDDSRLFVDIPKIPTREFLKQKNNQLQAK